MDSQTRIQRKIRNLTRDYTQKGYTVRVGEQVVGLPPSLGAYKPDLWLQQDGQNVWVVVHTSDTLEGANYLLELSQVLQDLPNWELELVLTNPRK